MLEFIKNNISWLKDLITLFFAGTATIIGILTYRKARYTILQPIRTETIKKQSELFSKLLDFLRLDYENEIDYVNVVSLSIFCSLRDYGFIFSDKDKMDNIIQNEFGAWIPCGQSKILQDITLIQTFDLKEDKKENHKYAKQRYDNLKNGIVDINKIYLTKKYVSFINELAKFISDPFLPLTVQKILVELNNTIYINITQILKQELEIFMLEYSKQYFTNGIPPKFEVAGVYNSFNHKKIHHQKMMTKLVSEIRKYLLIDAAWG